MITAKSKQCQKEQVIENGKSDCLNRKGTVNKGSRASAAGKAQKGNQTPGSEEEKKVKRRMGYKNPKECYDR